MKGDTHRDVLVYIEIIRFINLFAKMKMILLSTKS